MLTLPILISSMFSKTSVVSLSFSIDTLLTNLRILLFAVDAVLTPVFGFGFRSGAIWTSLVDSKNGCGILLTPDGIKTTRQNKEADASINANAVLRRPG